MLEVYNDSVYDLLAGAGDQSWADAAAREGGSVSARKSVPGTPDARKSAPGTPDARAPRASIGSARKSVHQLSDGTARLDVRSDASGARVAGTPLSCQSCVLAALVVIA